MALVSKIFGAATTVLVGLAVAPLATSAQEASAPPPASAAGSLPDLVVTRRDSLSLPMSIGGPLVLDMMNIGSTASGATTIRLSWDGRPGDSFYVPPLAPGARTGLRKVVPEGVQTLRVQINPDGAFPESRLDNNGFEESIGAGRATPMEALESAPPITETNPPASDAPPVTPQVKEPRTSEPRSAVVPATPPAVTPAPPPQPAGDASPKKPLALPAFKLPAGLRTGVLGVLGALGLLGLAILMLRMGRRGPKVTSVVMLPEFQARLITGNATVRSGPVSALDREFTNHEETHGNGAGPHDPEPAQGPTLWDVFGGSEELTDTQRHLVDSTLCIESIRAAVGVASDVYWQQVHASLMEALRKTLSVPVEQLLLDAWRSWPALQPALADSREVQNDVIVPPTDSMVMSSHHVHIGAELGGKPIYPGIDLNIDIICAVKTRRFVLRNGSVEADLQEAKVEGDVRCGTNGLMHREFSPLAMPAHIAMPKPRAGAVTRRAAPGATVPV